MEIRAIFTLALIVAIGTIVMVQQNATNQTGNQTNSSSSSIYPTQDAQAANCEKADVERNPSGNARGNAHECAFEGDPDTDTNPEPIRDCDRNGGSNAAHKNEFKDNDDDGFAGCVTRGDEEH